MGDEPSEDHQRRDLVVIGASAGGVATLTRIVADLPPQLPAAICIVLHISPDAPSLLQRILSRAGPLPCRSAADGDELRPGEILVAVPDRHLFIEDGRVRLTVGPRENGHRPAVDVLFRSAAEAKGRAVIGVVLSGSRGDGAAGLASIRAHGGITVVQDPDEALYRGMPATALAQVAVDAVVPSGSVADTVAAMVNGEEPSRHARGHRPDEPAGHTGSRESNPTICPECGGVLTEHLNDGLPLWECRVGHRFSWESLLDGQANDVEAALWAAIRALEDRSRVLERMAERFRSSGEERSERTFRRRASGAREQALIVRDALANHAQLSLARLAPSEADAVTERRSE